MPGTSLQVCARPVPRRDVRGRFWTGWVRSSRQSPRATAPVMAATGEGKDRRGDYQGTLADASSRTIHSGLGCCAGMVGGTRRRLRGGRRRPKSWCGQ